MKKDVLSVLVNYGGSMQTDVIFKFREPSDGGILELIGFDYENHCASCDNGNPRRYKFSENYLTNTRVETEYEEKGGKLVGTDKQTKIPPVKVNFYDARINESNYVGSVRPY